MKVLFKGGPWTNTEDEMLRAGVMKYGKQNWGRVASLVTRKTAAQCKARWADWLAPGLNKGEWTHEEDTRLLELFQAMPHLWRTIAGQLPGRTAGMCNERYEIVLDKARRAEAGDDSAAADKIDFSTQDNHFESKPARADVRDNDQYERDMLDAARGRLANTKGKKELRKMRDRKLQEARHRADMQRQRELREAGAGADATAAATATAKALGRETLRDCGTGPHHVGDDSAAAERVALVGARDDGSGDFAPVDVAMVDGEAAPPRKRPRGADDRAAAGAGAAPCLPSEAPAAAAAAAAAGPPVAKMAAFSFTFDAAQATRAVAARDARLRLEAAAAEAARAVATLPALRLQKPPPLTGPTRTAGRSFVALYNRPVPPCDAVPSSATGPAGKEEDAVYGPLLKRFCRPAPLPSPSRVARLGDGAWAAAAAAVRGSAEDRVVRETIAVVRQEVLGSSAEAPAEADAAAVGEIAASWVVAGDDPRHTAQCLIAAELSAARDAEAAALAAITVASVGRALHSTADASAVPTANGETAEIDGEVDGGGGGVAQLRAEATALLRLRDGLCAAADREAAALLRAAPAGLAPPPPPSSPAVAEEQRLRGLVMHRLLRRYEVERDVYATVRGEETRVIGLMKGAAKAAPPQRQKQRSFNGEASTKTAAVGCD